MVHAEDTVQIGSASAPRSRSFARRYRATQIAAQQVEAFVDGESRSEEGCTVARCERRGEDPPHAGVVQVRGGLGDLVDREQARLVRHQLGGALVTVPWRDTQAAPGGAVT